MARPNPRYGEIYVAPPPIVSTPIPTGTKTTPPNAQGGGRGTIVTQGGATVAAQGGDRGTTTQKTECYTVYGNDLQLTQAAVDYYRNIGVDISKCGTAPPAKNGVTRQEFEELKQAVWKYDPKTGMTVGTGSQRSLTDVWNHLSRWVWGHGGEQWQAGGMAEKWDKPEPTAIVPLFSQLHAEQEQRLSEAHAHRQSIEGKVEDLYSRKAEKGHGHNGNGTDWGVVVTGILAIVVILIVVKYLFPLLKGLKGIIPKRGNGNGTNGITRRVYSQ